MRSPKAMALVARAHLRWRRFQHAALSTQGITLKQYYVLSQLEKKSYLYPSRIAELLYCDRPTASVVIGNLEKHGWVSRRRDPDNGKRVRVALTAAGRQKLEAVDNAPLIEQKAAVEPLACFSDEEKDQFEALLGRLNKHLKLVTSDEELPPVAADLDMD
jgi:DNA-binding MarR family transcriptional regulator